MAAAGGPRPLADASQRFMLTLSRLWAWAFLGLMIVFFVIAVPIVTTAARSTS